MHAPHEPVARIIADPTHLDFLESEAIYILREMAGQFSKPALFFSGGKDSIVMAHLARKAFYPGRMPMPLVHIDTGRNFPEVLKFRDEFAERIGAQLIVGDMSDMIQRGKLEDVLEGQTRHFLQAAANTVLIEDQGFDAIGGGGRRDEEKARAKERILSHRDSFGMWDPKNQRAELWSIFNGRKHEGEHFRVFPISNWTEQDIWSYILREKLELPSLYFAHERRVFERQNALLDDETGFNTIRAGEKSAVQTVRFRTIGDVDTTGAVLSMASSVEEILAEVEVARSSERVTRATDAHSGGNGMEEFKRNGGF